MIENINNKQKPRGKIQPFVNCELQDESMWDFPSTYATPKLADDVLCLLLLLGMHMKGWSWEFITYIFLLLFFCTLIQTLCLINSSHRKIHHAWIQIKRRLQIMQEVMAVKVTPPKNIILITFLITGPCCRLSVIHQPLRAVTYSKSKS